MERIRQTSPYALAIFAFVFVGFMVISDVDISKITGKGRDYNSAIVAKVNGEDLLLSKYNEIKTQIEQQQKAEAREKQVEYVPDEKQIHRATWNQMLQSTILTQEAVKAGINVSDMQLQDFFFQNPVPAIAQSFMDTTGQFDSQSYFEFISDPEEFLVSKNPGMPQEQIDQTVKQVREILLSAEDNIRRNKMITALGAVTSAANGVIPAEYAKQRYIAENSTATANYIFVDMNSVTDSEIQVSDEEIKARYNLKKESFKQKALRKLRYIKFPIVPSIKDTVRAGKRMEKIGNELAKSDVLETRDSIFEVRMNEYGGETVDFKLMNDIDNSILTQIADLDVRGVRGPVRMHDGFYFFRLDAKRNGENEVVKASHILIKFHDNKDSAKTEIDKIYNKIKRGEDFAELAKKHSEDKGSGMRGGDLGYFGKNRMVKPFEEAAYSTEPGKYSKPFETVHGWHIVKVHDKKSDEISYSHIYVKPEVSGKTRRNIMRKAFALSKKATEGSSLDTLAAQNNLTVSETSYFPKGSPQLSSEYLTALAFKSEIGTIFQPVDLQENGIIVAELADARKEGYRAQEEVAARLKNEIMRSKKLDAIKAKAEDLHKKVLAGSNLEAAGVEVKNASGIKDNGTVPGLGMDYAFTAKVFASELGKISEPLRGQKGYYILKVISKNTPSDEVVKSALPEYMAEMKKKNDQMVFQTWFMQVMEVAEIDDMRSDHFKEY